MLLSVETGNLGRAHRGGRIEGWRGCHIPGINADLADEGIFS